MIYICRRVNDDKDNKSNFLFNLFINNQLNFCVMTKSMFAFSVATPKSKGDLSTTPELTATVTKDKIRLNGALTRKLLLQHGDRMMFISNEDAIIEAIANGTITEEEGKEQLSYAVAKSVPEVDAQGRIYKSIRRLSKAEEAAFAADPSAFETDEKGRPVETAMRGFKLSSTSGATGYGQILEGSDATHWPALGGNEEKHRVYKLGEEFTLEVSGVEVKAYVLEFDREEEKLERKAAEKRTVVGDEDQEMA